MPSSPSQSTKARFVAASRRITGCTARFATVLLTTLSLVVAPAHAGPSQPPSTHLDQATGVDYEQALWGIAAVGARSAWSVTEGAGVLIAVVDTGVDGSHPDLAGRVTAGYSTVTGKPIVAASDSDGGGHGTHVAGIIAASLNEFGVVGVAPAATIMPVQVLGPDGTGSDRTVADGIDWAVEHGAKVINLSLGGESNPFAVGASKSCAAVGRAFDADVVVVVAAGNDAASGNPLSEPASCRGALSVAAVDENLQRSYFSSFDGTVTLSAPGSAIVSTVPTSRRHAYAQWNGTSMAAPFVAGAAGLLRAAHPEWTAAEVVAALTSAAIDLGPVGTDPEFGAGLLDVAAALTGTERSLETIMKTTAAASLPRTIAVAADGKSVTVRWLAPINRPTSEISGYRIELFEPVETPAGARGMERVVAVVTAPSTSREWTVPSGVVPSAVRVSVLLRTPATNDVVRSGLPFYEIKDERPTTAVPDPSRVLSAKARWTDAGIAVTFDVDKPSGTVSISVNAGEGEFFVHRSIPANAGQTVFPFPADSPARSTSTRVSVATGLSERSVIVAPQFRIRLVATTAGAERVAYHGRTNEACNRKPRTGCAGSVVALTDARTGRVIAQTLVLANLRFGFDLPRDKAPKSVLVTSGQARSAVITTARFGVGGGSR